MKRYCLGMLVVTVLACGSFAHAKDDPGMALDSYQLEGAPVTVQGVEDNLSGLTYCETTDTLFAVLNKPMHLIELSKSGELKRIIPLNGFQDTEGVCWIEGNRFAVLEERRRRLVFITVEADTKQIALADCKTLTLLPPPNDNAGTEGIGFDPQQKVFFVVKEKNPSEVLTFGMPEGDADPEITRTMVDQVAGWGVTDLSGLHVVRKTGLLLVLSDEGKALMAVSKDGSVLSRLTLKAGSAGLDADVAQPEGVTVDKDGKLYIVSEPNTFLRFAPTSN